MRVDEASALKALECLIEGCSVRATERLTGIHRDTIMRLLALAGERCQRLIDARTSVDLSSRISRRRSARLKAFSRNPAHGKAASALHLAFYNYCRVHKTLRVTPAMEAGITDHVWSLAELLGAYVLFHTFTAAVSLRSFGVKTPEYFFSPLTALFAALTHA
jgi:hypothetical protein